jgi:uncharacterized membrane protein
MQSEPSHRTDRSGSALSLGSLAVVVASAVGSAAAYTVLPERLRIHWTLGTGPYYGPEFAPKSLLLVLFPLLIAGLALVGRWAVARARTIDEGGATRPHDALAVLAMLVAVLAGQAVLIVANL